VEVDSPATASASCNALRRRADPRAARQEPYEFALNAGETAVFPAISPTVENDTDSRSEPDGRGQGRRTLGRRQRRKGDCGKRSGTARSHQIDREKPRSPERSRQHRRRNRPRSRERHRRRGKVEREASAQLSKAAARPARRGRDTTLDLFGHDLVENRYPLFGIVPIRRL